MSVDGAAAAADARLHVTLVTNEAELGTQKSYAATISLTDFQSRVEMITGIAPSNQQMRVETAHGWRDVVCGASATTTLAAALAAAGATVATAADGAAPSPLRVCVGDSSGARDRMSAALAAASEAAVATPLGERAAKGALCTAVAVCVCVPLAVWLFFSRTLFTLATCECDC